MAECLDCASQSREDDTEWKRAVKVNTSHGAQGASDTLHASVTSPTRSHLFYLGRFTALIGPIAFCPPPVSFPLRL